jgi:hypothetical protein
MAPQAGHFTRRPAFSSLARKDLPQGQSKVIGTSEPPGESAVNARVHPLNDKASELRVDGEEKLPQSHRGHKGKSAGQLKIIPCLSVCLVFPRFTLS